MKRIDMTNVQEIGDFERVPAGAYVCVITDVEDVENEEYLNVQYDIANGKYAGYFEKTRNAKGWDWFGSYRKYYRTSSLGFFKRFCSAVSKSNGNFVFDAGTINADHNTLVGKKIGLVFQDEEYYSNSGDKRTRLVVFKECPVDKVAEQRTPNPKKLPDEPQNGGADAFMNIPDGMEEEMPF